MRLVEARSVPLLSPGVVKMEERKRPAPHGHEELAPPLKKQATAVNGGGKSHPDAEMPWKDELEVSFVVPHHRFDLLVPLSIRGHVLRSNRNRFPVALPKRCNMAADAGV